MNRFKPAILCCLLLLFTACAPSAKVEQVAQQIAPLIDPAKLATLRERGANPRVQKYTYWLVVAKLNRVDPGDVADRAVELAGYRGAAAKLTADAMVRNFSIAEKLGCLNAVGLEDMRRGQSPTITSGPYRGDELSVDHIIPRAVCPELDCVIANLELMPLRMNTSKGASMGQRQQDLAQKLKAAGLLSVTGFSVLTR